MIPVKTIRRKSATATARTGGSAWNGSGSASASGGSSAEAQHALNADLATRALNADLAAKATEAAKAAEADHARSAADLDADSPVLAKFLSRLVNDIAQGHITFEQGLTAALNSYFRGGSEWGTFVSGMMTGTGAAIDAKGNAEVQSIKVRGAMEVMELIINRLQALEGDQIFTENDTVETAVYTGSQAVDGHMLYCYTLTIRPKYDGYFTAITTGSVLKGIINDLASGGHTYATCWMLVTGVDASSHRIYVRLYHGTDCPEGSNAKPCALMKVARWGHQTDTRRQRLFYLSSSEGRIVRLEGVTRPIIDAGNYGSTFGILPEFLAPYLPQTLASDEGIYTKTLVAQNIIHVDHLGNVIEDEGQQPLYRMVMNTTQVKLTYTRYPTDQSRVSGTVSPAVITLLVQSSATGKAVADLAAEGFSFQVEYGNGGLSASESITGDSAPTTAVAGGIATIRTSGLINSVGGKVYRHAYMDIGLFKDGVQVDSQRVMLVVDGLQGEQGPQGPQGESVRGDRGIYIPVPRRWADYPAGYVFQAGGEGDERLDMVIDYATDGTPYYYQCTVGHTKSSSYRPTTNTTRWKVGMQWDFIATQLLMAERGRVENLFVNDVEVVDSDGTTRALLNAGEIYVNGDIEAGERGGKRVRLNPDEQTVEIYGTDGKLCTVLDGKTINNPLPQAAATINRATTITNPLSPKYSGTTNVLNKDGNCTLVAELSQLLAFSGSQLKVTLPQLTVRGRLAQRNAISVQRASGRAVVEIVVQRLISGTTYKDISSTTLGTYTVTSTTDSQLGVVYAGTYTFALPNGEQTYRVILRCTYAGFDGTLTWANTTGFAFSLDSSRFMSTFFANGLVLSQTYQNYFAVYAAGNVMRMWLASTDGSGLYINGRKQPYTLFAAVVLDSPSSSAPSFSANSVVGSAAIALSSGDYRLTINNVPASLNIYRVYVSAQPWSGYAPQISVVGITQSGTDLTVILRQIDPGNGANNTTSVRRNFSVEVRYY